MSRNSRANSKTDKSNPASASNSRNRIPIPIIAKQDDDDFDDEGNVYGDDSTLQTRPVTASTSGGHMTETTVPNFLLKLWKLVEDANYDFCIRWDESGSSFHVREPFAFSKDVLPLFFKHSNLNSFIRQLNMYGFRKVTSLEQGALKHQTNEMDTLEFHHQYFTRGRPDLLQYIKRKNSNVRSVAGGELIDLQQGGANNRGLNHILDEVRQLREKQVGMDSKLYQVKKENEALWREIAHMRQMHLKQQQVVGKLMQFLMNVVQPTSGGRPLSKRSLLAIGSNLLNQDAPSSKRMRMDSTDAVDIIESLEQELRDKNRTPVAVSPNSVADVGNGGGPMIADITDDAESEIGPELSNVETNEYAVGPRSEMQNQMGHLESIISNNGSGQETSTAADGTQSLGNLATSASDNLYFQQQQQPVVDEKLGSSQAMWTNSGKAENSFKEGQAKAGYDDLPLMSPLGNLVDSDQQSWSKPEFSQYLNFVQSDLDSLQDFLSSEGLDVEVDPNSLNDLFTAATPPDTTGSTSEVSPSKVIVGNEVQVYKEPELLVNFDAGANNGYENPMSSANAVSNASNAIDSMSGLEPKDLYYQNHDSSIFAMPVVPEQHQESIFDAPNSNVFSAASLVNPIPQSPLMTPVMSPNPNLMSTLDPMMGQQQQRQQIDRSAQSINQPRQGNGVSTAVDDLLRATVSKSGKRR